MIDPYISKLIRQKRRSDGLTVQQLAEKADVSISLISKLERNVLTTINLDKLSSITESLGLTLGDLFGTPDVNKDTQDVINYLLSLSSSEQQIISRALKTILIQKKDD